MDVGGKRHVLRLGEIYATVGSATVFVQRDDENTTIRKSDANVSVVGIGTGDKRPQGRRIPRSRLRRAANRGSKARLNRRGARGRPGGPTGNRNRTNRMTIVHEKGRGGGVGNGESMLKEGGKTKFGKDSRKVRVRDPVVGFLLIKENQRTVHRGAAESESEAAASSEK